MSQTFLSRGSVTDRKVVALHALAEGLAVGPARLVRDLGRTRVANRWLARVPSDASLFQMYILHPGLAEPPAVLGVADRLRGRHLVSILGSGTDGSGRTWALSPYSGDVEGLRSLADLLKLRPGHQMPVYEVGVAANQLLDAANDLRRHGMSFAGLTGREVLIDRRGSVRVEIINATRTASDAPMADDTHDLGVLVYEMLTGATPGGGFTPPSRLAAGVGRAWDRWTERALSRGFESLTAAASALPSPRGR